jgi:hypothetical protein
MNPYHDDDGRFTTREHAQTMGQARTEPRNSAQHSPRHQAAIAAGKDPRRPEHPLAPASVRRTEELIRMSPEQARAYLDQLDKAEGHHQADPSLAVEVLHFIRHPFTPPAPAKRPATPAARPSASTGEPATSVGGSSPEPHAGPKRPPARLKPEEVRAIREALPDGVATNNDANRRDRGLPPYRRAHGPRLITSIPDLGAPNVQELHARLGTGLHLRIVRDADRSGSKNVPGNAWPQPGAPHPSNPFAPKPRGKGR